MFSRVAKWISEKRRQRKEAAFFERAVVVQTDEQGITAHYPGGAILSIRWDEVHCVAIETNDSGPWERMCGG